MENRRLTALVLSALLLSGCGNAAPSAGSAPPSAPDFSAPESESDTFSGVRVDWSKLTEKTPRQPDVDGGQWYPDFTDHLIPGADYGLLLPYIGDQAYPFNRWEYEGEIQEYYHDYATSFYGLMTQEGKIVTDPVYQSVWPYSYRWEGEDHALPVLLLGRTDPNWGEAGNGLRYAAAASDGSWATDFEFLSYTNRGDQLFLVGPDGCTRLDSSTGTRRDWSWAELGLQEDEISEAISFIQWVTGLNWLDQGVCLGQRTGLEQDREKSHVLVFDPGTEQASWTTMGQWDEWYSEYFSQRWGEREEIRQDGGQTVVILAGRTYPLTDAPENCYSISRDGDLIILGGSDAVYCLYRLSTGEKLLEGTDIELISDLEHHETVLPVAYARGAWTVYDEALNPLLTLPATQSGQWVHFTLRDGLLSASCESIFFGCYDLNAGKYVFFRNMGLGD